MRLFKSLFGKTGQQKHPGSQQRSSLLQAMAAELPQWPPERRRILEPILIEAAEAGVSSMEEMSAFLDARPELRVGFTKAIVGFQGPEWGEVVSTFPSEAEPPPFDRLKIFKAGNPTEISSPEELEAYYHQNPEESIKVSTHLLERAQASGDRLSEGFALGFMGLAYARLQQMPKAIHCFERHLEIARALGNRQWEMADYDNLGHAHLELGDLECARVLYEEALALAQRRSDQEWIIKYSTSLASVYHRLGDGKRAAILAKRIIKLSNANSG